MNWKLLTIALIFLVGAFNVYSSPNGPTSYEVLGSERSGITTQVAANISAMAGNITEIKMNASAITKSWQGYFGNISGKITLDDANNMTLYNWDYASPLGRVYAARIDSVVWTNISCMRFDADGSQYPNVTIEEGIMGSSATDSDGLDETFASASHDELIIGTVTIAANTCNSTALFINDAAQSTDFKEVLLTDNSSNLSIIYTAILEQDVAGFNNKAMDFEMLVSENGHSGDETATPYYFWVELI